MKESKQKVCKLPGCQKEIYDRKSLFCGDHERIFHDFRNKAAIVAKNITNKKS